MTGKGLEPPTEIITTGFCFPSSLALIAGIAGTNATLTDAGTGVAVGVGVGVGVAVGVGVGVALTGVGVAVGDGDAVAVAVGDGAVEGLIAGDGDVCALTGATAPPDPPEHPATIGQNKSMPVKDHDLRRTPALRRQVGNS